MEKKQWTKEEEKTLKKLYKSGIKIKDIATTMGRSYNSLDNKLAKLCVSDRAFREIRDLRRHRERPLEEREKARSFFGKVLNLHIFRKENQR